MKTKLSTNSIVKLILMEVVVVLIYYMGIGAIVEIITWLCYWPRIYLHADLPDGAWWGDAWSDEYIVADMVEAKYVRDITFCIITLMQIVAASFFLNNVRYWLCSLVPQFTLFSLLWLVWSKMDWLITMQDVASFRILTNYWLSIATIFGAQLIGVLINFLFRWVARKLRARAGRITTMDIAG